MSKELPYFRFTSFEWLNDDISLEDYETKGVFIDICAYYWFKDCSITKAMLEKRFSNAISVIKRLFDSGIIKFKNGDDYIDISFLNKQFDQLSELRRARQDAGSKGGKQKASKAKILLQQKSSYKDKDKDKDKTEKDHLLKHQHLEFILLTDEELNKLIKQFGEQSTKERIARLNDYVGSKGVKYKSHYHTILNWARKDEPKANNQNRRVL